MFVLSLQRPESTVRGCIGEHVTEEKENKQEGA